MLPRLDKKRRMIFVDDYLAGKIFTSYHIAKYHRALCVKQVFYPVHNGRHLLLPEEDQDDIGMFWEYLDQANALIINSYPTFMTCKLMHRKDVYKVASQINSRIYKNGKKDNKYVVRLAQDIFDQFHVQAISEEGSK